MTSRLSVFSGIEYFGRTMSSDAAWTDGDRTLTFGAIEDRSTRAAVAFLSWGLPAGSHIMVMLDNCLEYPEIIAGITKAGHVIVPVNTYSTEAEAAAFAKRCDVKAIITQRSYLDRMAGAIALIDETRLFTVDDNPDARHWQSHIAAGSAGVRLDDIDEMATFCVSFTGGTTGQPKGVMLNHRSRALTFHYMALDFNVGPNRRTINATPLYHGAGMAYGYGFLNAGAHVQTMRRWDPEHLLRLVRDHRPHQLFLVPSQISDLRDLGLDRMRDAGFHTIETAFATAAPLPHELKTWFIEEFPDIVFADVYGGTEAGVITVHKTPELGRRERCAGPAWFMTEVKLLDENRNEVAPGEPGELFSRSPYLFNGYLNDPEQTRDVMTDDGFVTAGDMSIVDEDGYYYIVDRSKDMIISGGVNVYPREVEEALLAHSDVRDVAVVGVPHQRWGEEIVAILVVSPDSTVDDTHLQEYCAQTLAKFKIPKRFLRRDSLDRTVTGKLRKNELREWAVSVTAASS